LGFAVEDDSSIINSISAKNRSYLPPTQTHFLVRDSFYLIGTVVVYSNSELKNLQFLELEVISYRIDGNI